MKRSTWLTTIPVTPPGADPGPPPGTGPGEGPPGPGDGGDGGGGGGGGDDDDDDEEETPEQKLDYAVADALERLEACRVRNGNSSYHPGEAISAAQAAANIFDEIPHDGPSCSNAADPIAHVNAISGSEIHICPPFYSLSPALQSRTIIHEGLHLIGIRHQHFDGATDPGDGGPMNAAITSSCYDE